MAASKKVVPYSMSVEVWS